VSYFSWFRTSLSLVLLAFSLSSFAATSVKDIEVAKAEIFMPQSNSTATGAKMTIYNRSDKPLIISDVTSDRFKHSMLHGTKYVVGKREMYEVQTITVPAHQKLALTPNTTHIMLMGLTQPLQMGELISLSLNTNQGRVTVIARVAAMHLR